MPIDSVAAAANPLPTAEPKANPNKMDQQAFLKLLVAQMKYQNPMDPMKGNEFVAQSAQFTMVERLEELVKHQAEALTSNQSLAALSLIGRPVSYLGADGEISSGVVSSARLGSKGPVLSIGGADVELERIIEVRATGASTPTTTPPGETTSPDPSTTTTPPAGTPDQPA